MSRKTGRSRNSCHELSLKWSRFQHFTEGGLSNVRCLTPFGLHKLLYNTFHSSINRLTLTLKKKISSSPIKNRSQTIEGPVTLYLLTLGISKKNLLNSELISFYTSIVLGSNY